MILEHAHEVMTSDFGFTCLTVSQTRSLPPIPVGTGQSRGGENELHDFHLPVPPTYLPNGPQGPSPSLQLAALSVYCLNTTLVVDNLYKAAASMSRTR